MSVISARAVPTGNLKGAEHGTTISVILDDSEPGHGPRLHKHPYDETWIAIEGNLPFQAGEDELTAGPGDIVIVPPEMPHKFTDDGPGRCNLVCIHANPTFVTEWLEKAHELLNLHVLEGERTIQVGNELRVARQGELAIA